MRVGFIGLGIMGRRMAANLLDADHDLVVWNRNPERMEPLVAAGATGADSPAGVAGQVGILFTMLAHPEAVVETAFGEEGFLNHLPDGALWADCSTVNPSFSREIAREAAERGVRYVDSPVAGTKGPAEEGTLIFLVGGDEDDVAACRPFFEVMGRRTVHLGRVSMGVSMKMVVNLLLGQAMAAFSEAMALGQALGFSQETLLDFLVGGAVTAPFIAGKRQRIESGEFEPAFPLKWMLKDLHLAGQTAYEQDVAVPLTATVEQLYTLAAHRGLDDDDFSAIYAFLNGLA